MATFKGMLAHPKDMLIAELDWNAGAFGGTADDSDSNGEGWVYLKAAAVDLSMGTLGTISSTNNAYDGWTLIFMRRSPSVATNLLQGRHGIVFAYTGSTRKVQVTRTIGWPTNNFTQANYNNAYVLLVRNSATEVFV